MRINRSFRRLVELYLALERSIDELVQKQGLHGIDPGVSFRYVNAVIVLAYVDELLQPFVTYSHGLRSYRARDLLQCMRMRIGSALPRHDAE